MEKPLTALLLGPLGNELGLLVGVHDRHLLPGEREQVGRQRLGAADAGVRIPEAVEEPVHAALQPRGACLGVVDQELRDIVDGFGRRLRAEDLVPGVRLDLGKLELRVVGVHRCELLARGRAQHLDDLHQLVHTALPGEDGLPQDELGGHTRGRPDVDDCRVVRGSKNQLWRSVVARADVRDVGLPLHKPLGRAEVAQLQRVRVAVHEEVLRLDVAVADPHSVDVRTGAAHLVGVQLHEDVRHRLLHLDVMLHDTVNRVAAVLHHHVEVGLARLIPGCVEGMLQLHHIGVTQLLHDLQLAVLVPLVLEHLLDGHGLPGLDHLSLVHDPEGPAAQHALRVVGE
mmetsp:Transcript_6086/g.17155  ORF Transcript_6086/g.17155 Transcript_6086/m.17155 type:complete len:342 (+) Transcript_6086:192-1217(+)